jgi:glutathione synthase/RimK-type ligase-like ATP-grasp enzyme
VATQGELLLAYGKESALQGGEDLNPLHQSNGRAVRLEEGALLEAIGDLVRQVAEVVELGFYAIDLIEGKEGLRILELNPNPFCFFYNKDNGRSDFVAIYRKLLEKYAL